MASLSEPILIDLVRIGLLLYLVVLTITYMLLGSPLPTELTIPPAHKHYKKTKSSLRSKKSHSRLSVTVNAGGGGTATSASALGSPVLSLKDLPLQVMPLQQQQQQEWILGYSDGFSPELITTAVQVFSTAVANYGAKLEPKPLALLHGFGNQENMVTWEDWGSYLPSLNQRGAGGGGIMFCLDVTDKLVKDFVDWTEQQRKDYLMAQRVLEPLDYAVFAINNQSPEQQQLQIDLGTLLDQNLEALGGTRRYPLVSTAQLGKSPSP